MAKKSFIEWENEYIARINLYTRKVQQLYLLAVREAVKIGVSISDYDDKQPFTFDAYPQTKSRIAKVIDRLYKEMVVTIEEATKNEWLEACRKNDELVDFVASSTRLTKAQIVKYYGRNLDALAAFQKRKDNGLNLSDRIWRYTDQFRQEIEMGLDIGLGDGRSADELSRDLRKYLQEPEKLFRRIRDKENRERFYLSRNAAAYHPGAGMYRSSYKNALRMTRTEVNMAYRSSDYERWQNLDFVVGFEVRRSNNVFDCPVCNALKGKYPKTFKFVGWHPQCRCMVIPILATQKEFVGYQKELLINEQAPQLSSRNAVRALPRGFRKWVFDNRNRTAKAISIPYFIRDNKAVLDGNGIR